MRASPAGAGPGPGRLRGRTRCRSARRPRRGAARACGRPRRHVASPPAGTAARDPPCWFPLPPNDFRRGRVRDGPADSTRWPARRMSPEIRMSVTESRPSSSTFALSVSSSTGTPVNSLTVCRTSSCPAVGAIEGVGNERRLSFITSLDSRPATATTKAKRKSFSTMLESTATERFGQASLRVRAGETPRRRAGSARYRKRAWRRNSD
ncbi:Uncharacterised protein [Mycobacteroides abscessus subsp. abscessus]|nr:Uncharacterised protein [Mycobacteroides abscessus subsp. abscessus]